MLSRNLLFMNAILRCGAFAVLLWFPRPLGLYVQAGAAILGCSMVAMYVVDNHRQAKRSYLEMKRAHEQHELELRELLDSPPRG